AGLSSAYLVLRRRIWRSDHASRSDRRLSWTVSVFRTGRPLALISGLGRTDSALQCPLLTQSGHPLAQHTLPLCPVLISFEPACRHGGGRFYGPDLVDPYRQAAGVSSQGRKLRSFQRDQFRFLAASRHCRLLLALPLPDSFARLSNAVPYRVRWS